MKDLNITADLEAEILAAGAAIGAAKTKTRKPRPKMTDAAMAAALAGKMPEPLTFPASNAYAQKHADAMLALAQADDRDAVAAYQIGGTNTYSKALRRYQAALVEFLSRPIPLPIKAKKKPAKKEAA